jgi:hypothetical protein
MKRITLAACAGLLCAGLLATPADAAVRHFQGTVTGGGTVEFDVFFRKGVPRSAGNFEADGIPVDCQPTDTRVNFSTSRFVRIVDRKFVYVFRSFTARFAGRIKGNNVQSVGKLSYGPNDFPESGRTGCTTGGPRSWRAHL